VNDAVIISPPYLIENCQVEKDKQSSLIHVKKILEGYFARKQSQMSAQSLPSSNGPAAPSPQPAVPKVAVATGSISRKGG